MPYVNIKETCFDEETMSYALIRGVSSSSSSSYSSSSSSFYYVFICYSLNVSELVVI